MEDAKRAHDGKRAQARALVRVERVLARERDAVSSRVTSSHPETPMRYVFSRFLAVAALAASACHDPVAPLGAPGSSRAPTDGAELRDAAIMTDDSWLTATVTTVTDGALMNSADLEAGYGSGGELRLSVYWQPIPSSSGFAGIRYVGDRVEMLNAAGAVVSSNTFNGHMTEIGLPGGTLVGAIFMTQDPGTPGCNPADPGCLATVRGEESPGSSVDRSLDERRLRRRVRPARTTTAVTGEDDYADVERVFRRQRQPGGAGLWRLEEVHEERRVTTDRGSRVQRTTTRFRYTRYQMKPAREAAREAARAAELRAGPSPVVSPPPAAARVVDGAASRDALVPYAGTDAGGLLDPFCRQGTRNDHSFTSKTARGYSIIYQHGFCSDAAAFDGVRPRIAASFPVVRERAYSLNSTDGIEQQATDLIARAGDAGATRNIIIGHSQGGLVARRVGQRAPAYVSSVITIGSPQNGSLLAALGPEAINALAAEISAEMCATDFLCELVAGVVEQQLNGRLSVALLDNGAPSLQDMAPGSPFLLSLNSTFEPFARASVETDVGNRWAIARMIGDGRSPVSGLLLDRRPAGDAWVTRAEKTYWTAQSLKYLSLISLFWREAWGNGVNCVQPIYAAYWEPCAPTSSTDLGASWWQEILAMNTLLLTFIITAAMDAIDGAWDYATTRRQPGTDGLIDSYSQRYPEAPGAFVPERFKVVAPHADSHSGQLASPSTLQRTMDAIRSLSVKNP
jgi:pimeloyl-ACP methyl ester carboxylesterase